MKTEFDFIFIFLSFWPPMNFPSYSYDTLFLNLWPLIAGVLLSWHRGLVNAHVGSDSRYLSIYFFSLY